MTKLERSTRETQVSVEILADPSATAVDLEVPFLRHMMETLARYAGLGLRVTGRGDLPHHLIEDVAITLGAAIAQYAPEGMARYGDRTVPMDDALVQCALDLGGRPFYRGPIPSTLYDHWMRSFADHARATLHLRVLRGQDRHHVVEGAFKALGFALRDALRADAGGSVFSTKGRVALSGGVD